jgi:hypothetical protein
MAELRGARVILRDKKVEDAEQDYIWRCDPELAELDAAYPLTMIRPLPQDVPGPVALPHPRLPPFRH